MKGHYSIGGTHFSLNHDYGRKDKKSKSCFVAEKNHEQGMLLSSCHDQTQMIGVHYGIAVCVVTFCPEEEDHNLSCRLYTKV